MPPRKLELERTDKEAYATAGLSQKQFIQAMNRIRKEQAKNRTKAKRTLTPAALKRRNVSDLVKLGRKPDGRPFNENDLKRMDQMAKKFKKRRGTTQGITYREIVGKGRKIDIKRANNQVDDGSGIKNARLLGIREGSMAMVRVKASMRSKHQEHMVRIRFEEWQDRLVEGDGSLKSYQQLAKKMVKGRVSIDCDCGRHQYWYRYMATIGGYQIKPPSELAFPKIRNPNLTGVTCKHVTKTMIMMQSPAWYNLLAVRMQKQATTSGFADSKRKMDLLSKEEQKLAAKNRKNKESQAKLRDEHRKYVQRANAAAKKYEREQEKIKKLQEKLKRRKLKEERQREEIKKLREENKKLKELAKDKIRLQLSSFLDGAELAGIGENAAYTAFSKKTGIPVKKLRELNK